MMKIFLSILVYFSLTFICKGQRLEKIQRIDKGENISDVTFGEGTDLFVLGYDGQVKKVTADSISSSAFINVKATAMEFSKSSAVLALGTFDGRLLIFNNQEQVKNFPAHRHPISHIAFSPSNQYLATSSSDSTLKIWSAKTYELLQVLPTKSDLVTAIKFSMDEEFLVYSTAKGKILVWNLNEKKLSATHQVSNKWIRDIAISPDSMKYAVCGDDKKITILSFKNNDTYQLKKSHKNSITNMQFLTRHYLLSVGHDHIVSMNNINLPDEKSEIKHFKGYARYKRSLYDLSGDKYFSGISISNDQKTVAVSSYGKGIALTNDFQKIIENPHVVTLKELDNKKITSMGVDPEFEVKNNSCILKGCITRPNEIKNAWLYFVKDDKQIQIKVDKSGYFKLQAGVFGGKYEYVIVVEDWDKNLKTVRYNFTLKQSE